MFILSVSSLKCSSPSQEWTERRKLLDGMERWCWTTASPYKLTNKQIKNQCCNYHPSPPPDLLSERLLSNASGSSELIKTSLQYCVCYGLGNFASCVSARYQLAMLLLLLETLQVYRFHLYDMTCPVKHCILNAINTLSFSDSSGKLLCVWSGVFCIRVWCSQRARLHRTDWKWGAAHVDCQKTFVLLSVFSIIFLTGGKAPSLSTHPVLPDALWEGSV